VSLESDDIVRDYKVIRAELKEYNQDLAEKPEIVILTKTDMVDEKGLAAAKKKITKFNKDILEATVLDDNSVKELKDNLVKRLRKLK
jgi:GTP-binding protein